MQRYKYLTGKAVLFFGSIIIGVPMGFFHGLIYFLKSIVLIPHIMYHESLYRWLKNAQRQAQPQDIWERHIKRMEDKKNNYDN